MTEKLKVLFIAGEGRSGGTLIGSALGSVEPFVYVGEIRNLWHETIPDDEPCGCSKPISQCEFWQDVLELAMDQMDRSDPSRVMALQRSIARERYTPLLSFFGWVPADTLKPSAPAEYSRLIERLYRAISSISQRSVIVDSSREVSSALLLSRLEAIDLKILHLVRDSRAVAYSFSRRKAQFEHGDRRKYLPQYSALQAALHWIWSNAWASRFGRRAPEKVAYARLRYEDFVRSPSQLLTTALSQLGFREFSCSHIDEQIINVRAGHAVSANPAKFRSGLIDVRVDNEWEIAMDRRQRRLVTLLTGAFIRRYGYSGT